MGVTPEGRVKNTVKRVLKRFEEEFDCELYTNWPVPGGYGESMLDLVGCAFGKFFAIETKAPGKTITERQRQCAARMERAGAKVFIIDQTDAEHEQFRQLWFWLITQYRLSRNTDNEIDQDGRVRVRV